MIKRIIPLFVFTLILASVFGRGASAAESSAMDIDVTGCWDDEEDLDGIRPQSVTVSLYANGNDTGRTITLSEENDWSGTFEDLEVFAEGVRQSYSIVEERLDGYTGLISGCDQSGYRITNTHEPFPEGRSSQEEIANRGKGSDLEGRVAATVLTTKVSRTMPARTSTTIKKTRSVKTADSACPIFWLLLLLFSLGALFVWMRVEQGKE